MNGKSNAFDESLGRQGNPGTYLNHILSFNLPFLLTPTTQVVLGDHMLHRWQFRSRATMLPYDCISVGTATIHADVGVVGRVDSQDGKRLGPQCPRSEDDGLVQPDLQLYFWCFASHGALLF